jgi:hypothetical protein
MNKRIAATLLAFIIHYSAHSQSLEGRNMGKVNLSSFVVKGLSVQYERQIGKRITVGLGYGKIPSSGIAFKSFIENQINNDQAKAAFIDIQSFNLGTSIFTPEARYYFGKQGAFRGFYIATYARFGHYSLDGPVQYTSSTGSKRTLFFSGSLTATTAGLMLGSSFNLHKRLYLDWWIIGGSIGNGSGNFVAQTALSTDEQQSVRNSLATLDIPNTTIHSDVNGNGATINSTGIMVGLRGLGINLGIRF